MLDMELTELRKLKWSEGGNKSAMKSNYSICTDYLDLVLKASSLSELFDLHKAMWNSGVRDYKSFGPNEYGMFRCSDIADMKMDDVFLGNINGLWTYRLPFWETMCLNDPDNVYQTILNQYRNQLSSGIENVRSMIYDNGINRKSVEAHISRKYDVDARIIDKSIGPDRLCTLEVGSQLGMTQTKMFIFGSGRDRRFLLPEDFLHGQNPSNGRQIKNTVWMDIYTGSRHGLKKSLLSGISLVEAPDRKPARKIYDRMNDGSAENHRNLKTKL